MRSRSIAARMMRDTCICDTPTISPISACVMSWRKRSVRTVRSRGVSSLKRIASVARSSARSKPSSWSPSRSPRVDAVLLVAARRAQGSRAAGAAGLERLEDVLVAHREVLGELGHGRRAPERRRQLARRLLDAQRELLQVARRPHRPRLVAEMALDLAEHGRHREGGERDPPVGIEAVDRLQEAERRDLHDVLQRLGLAPVAHGDLAGESHEALDELLARVLVVLFLEAQEQLTVAPVALASRRAHDGPLGRPVLGAEHRGTGGLGHGDASSVPGKRAHRLCTRRAWRVGAQHAAFMPPGCPAALMRPAQGDWGAGVSGQAGSHDACRAARLRTAGPARFLPAWVSFVTRSARACSCLPVPTEVVEDISLAVSEAATNVVLHAYVGDSEPGPLVLSARVMDDRVHVVIRDHGRGMTPRPDSPGLGLGLPLMTGWPTPCRSPRIPRAGPRCA